MIPLFKLVRPLMLAATVILPLAAAPQPAGPQSAAPPPAPLTQGELVSGLTRDLRAHFSLDGELELHLMRDWAAPQQVAAKWSVTVDEFPGMPGSVMMVHATIRGDNAPPIRQEFMVEASLWRDVWASRQPLSAGEVFDPGVLEVRRVDAFRERDALPASTGDDNYIFARGLPAGRLLTWIDIARRPLVHRGQLVDVTAIDGALSVTMKAVAMMDGARGDTVRLRNPQSQREFSAIVVDENRAQIHL